MFDCKEHSKSENSVSVLFNFIYKYRKIQKKEENPQKNLKIGKFFCHEELENEKWISRSAGRFFLEKN